MTRQPPPPPPPGPPYRAAPQYGYTYGPAPVITRTNGLAIASMVLSITSVFLGIFFVPQILGIVFGHVSMAQIRRSQGTEQGAGMAIAGLVVGYVMLVLWIVIWIAAASSDNSGTNY